MIRRDFLTGHWKPYLDHAISLSPCYDGPINGGEASVFIHFQKSSLPCAIVEIVMKCYKWNMFDEFFKVQVAASILEDAAVGKIHLSDKVRKSYLDHVVITYQ